MMKLKINTYLYLVLLFVGFLLAGNLISLIIAYLAEIPLEMLMEMNQETGMDNLYTVKLIVGINHFAGFTLASIFFIKWKKKLFFPMYLSLDKQPKLTILFASFALLLLSYPLIAYSTSLDQWLNLPDWAKSMDDDAIGKLKYILHMESPIDLFINLLIIAILPGLGEEFLFRGILQREFYRSFKSPHVAIWIAAFIFSAFHLQIEGFMAKMILGLLFGYIYYYTRNLWYPILLHIINNGMQVISVYLAGDLFEAQSLEESPSIPFPLALSSFLLLGGVWFFYNKYNNKLET